MKSSVNQLLAALPGPVSTQWPDGEHFVHALSHGSMRVELYVPLASDPQLPHEQDELYFIEHGQADLMQDEGTLRAAAGDVLFVAAGRRHYFANISADFRTWVVFWGPIGGESRVPCGDQAARFSDIKTEDKKI
jgi:hypothetical protein